MTGLARPHLSYEAYLRRLSQAQKAFIDMLVVSGEYAVPIGRYASGWMRTARSLVRLGLITLNRDASRVYVAKLWATVEPPPNPETST